MESSSPKPSQGATRPLTSCSECSRRKTKCDKLSPCSPCIKRGKTHICRVEKRRDVDAAPTEPLPTDFDRLCLAAFGELNSMRTHFDGMRDRLSAMEAMLAKTFEAARGQGGGGGGGSAGGASDAGGAGAGYHDIGVGVSDYQVYPPMERSPSAPKEPLEELMGEELDASVTLEFAALGRTRMFGATQDDRSSASHLSPSRSDPASPPFVYPATTPNVLPSRTPFPLSQPASILYPSATALVDSMPSRAQSEALINHALEWTSWHHGSIYIPGFRKEVEDFWDWGESRVELCDPLWLALYFAQLVAGLKHLPRASLLTLGYRSADVHTLSKQWLDCAIACLYRGHFLENHSIYTVQAIVVLLCCAQDAGNTNIFSTLINAGMATAQDMGLHRMSSDEEWERSMTGQTSTVRGRSLIDREIRKRAFFALVVQDWFSIAYRSTYTIQPSQIKTPYPMNAHDSDLAAGLAFARPTSSYTLAGTLIIWIKIARSLFAIFQHLDNNATPSYQFLLEADKDLQAIIDNAPAWLVEGGPTENMPPPVDWIRNTFQISSSHKILTLHRPFLTRAFRDKRYESSRIRAIEASRRILREAERSSGSRLWTIPYHVSAAACVVALDLFQQLSSSSPVLAEERAEIQSAVSALISMQDLSPIAARGVALISNLLGEEARLRLERHAAGPLKRRRAHDEHEAGDRMAKIAKFLADEEGVGGGGRGGPEFDPAPQVAEYPFSSARLEDGMGLALAAGEDFIVPGLEEVVQPQKPFASFERDQEAISAEYMAIFLGSGFDPLGGALGADAFEDGGALGEFGFGESEVGGGGGGDGWPQFEAAYDLQV